MDNVASNDRFDTGRQAQKLAPLTAHSYAIRKLIYALGLALGNWFGRRNIPINERFSDAAGKREIAAAIALFAAVCQPSSEKKAIDRAETGII